MLPLRRTGSRLSLIASAFLIATGCTGGSGDFSKTLLPSLIKASA